MFEHLEYMSQDIRKAPSGSIAMEEYWRRPTTTPAESSPDNSSVLVARWTCMTGGAGELHNDRCLPYHTVGINLRRTSLVFAQAGYTLHDGPLVPGVVQVAAPGAFTRALFREPCDVLHLFIPQQVLEDCFEDTFGHSFAGRLSLDDPRFHRDRAIEHLGQMLVDSPTTGAPVGRVFTDSVTLAIALRLVGRHFTSKRPRDQKVAALSNWRLKRTLEYVDAHLSDTITLNDIAAHSGLTRMHFAAQFRCATGYRPHEYLLRRRIERAQTLLLQPNHCINEVALSCGFKTQTHFTTVFRRFVGDTPCAWRRKAHVVQCSRPIGSAYA